MVATAEDRAHLAEGEGLVGYELEAGAVHFPRPVAVPRVQLLPQGVVDPQVYVPLPVPLLWRWWYIGNGPLIGLAYLISDHTSKLTHQQKAKRAHKESVLWHEQGIRACVKHIPKQPGSCVAKRWLSLLQYSRPQQQPASIQLADGKVRHRER